MLLKVSILRGMQQRRFALNNYVSKKTMVPQGDDRNNEKKKLITLRLHSAIRSQTNDVVEKPPAKEIGRNVQNCVTKLK